MKAFTLTAFALVATASTAAALPTVKRAVFANDSAILNFALTLEHLENAFYTDALAKYDAAAFKAAGYPAAVREAVVDVASDEKTHVKFLSKSLAAIGAKAVEPCTYKFPYTDVKSFLATGQILEGVGASAYLGALSSIKNKVYLTAAGTIATIEGRHNTFFRAINGETPLPAPFDTPVGAQSIVTLATPFFVTCPAGSAPSIKPFPTLTVTTEDGKPVASGHSWLEVKADKAGAAKKCVFLSGMDTTSSDLVNCKCEVPQEVANGQAYVFLSTSDVVTDATTVAGPALLDVNPKAGGHFY